ncbi:uncharacterized protein LOC134273887 [Saccostrea cucullata]|uniref:uncharacterized protein LOC134273887 n=1 Tax=Saccostrea cuccullata TaxID=36930 RepID=UPI002ED120A7
MHRPEYGISAGTRLFDRGPHNPIPTHNYLSGGGKSLIWRGPSHYVTSERTWIDQQQYRSLPRDTKRDAKEMQSEDQWVDFMRQRDTPSGYYHKDIGVLQTGIPECRLFGYTRDLPSMPPRNLQDISWPKSDAFVPLERADRGKYYGYHEVIERERERRKKELPESMRVEARDISML